MTFMARHRESEDLAAQAEAAAHRRSFEEAAKLYSLAADAELEALSSLGASKRRTRGIVAVSVAALYYKGRQYESTLKFATQWLSQSLLPEFARSELASLVEMTQLRKRIETEDFFLTGESLVGDGNEIAHIDLIIGTKAGWAGQAFVRALSRQSDGFSTLLAVVTPNLPAKPDTLIFNKVTIKGAKQAVQMFGPAQAAVARAVVESVAAGTIPKSRVDDLCVLAGVFIHWQAEEDLKIFEFNFRATTEAIMRAMQGWPSVEDVLRKYKSARHPFMSIDAQLGTNY